MKHRIFALFLVLVLLLGILSGCGKKNDTNSDGTNGSNTVVTPTKNDQSQVTSKYAYKPTYLTVPAEVDSISGISASGNTVWFAANVKDGEQTETYTYTDENGEEQTETYTYDTYKTVLYSLDLESQVCQAVPDLTLPAVEEGWEGNSYVNNFQIMSDGSIWIFCIVNQYKTELPDDFDPETDDEWQYQINENRTTMVHLDGTGKELTRFDLVPPASDDASADASGGVDDNFGIAQYEAAYQSNISSIVVGEDGTIYGYDWQNVYLFDETGACTATIEANEYSGNLMRYDANTVGMNTYVYNQETETSTNYFVPINAETKAFDKEGKVELPNSAWNIYPGVGEYDLLYDNDSKIFGYIASSDTSEKILDWMDSDINPNNMNSYSVLDDGRVIASLRNWDDETQENSNELVLMTRVDASTLPEKTVLTLACFYLDYQMRGRIVEFNKNSDSYRIVVKDYSEYNTDEDYTAGITKLNTEIMSGVIPDMFLTDNMPIDRYAAKGILTDLYALIDSDSELTRDSFVPEVLKACETDGKLYRMPVSFMVQTAYGLSKVVDGYDVWNVAALQDALSKLQEGAYAFDFYNTQSDMMSTCIARNLSAFVNWQTGQCSFDSEGFIALLNFVKTFPAEFDWDTYNNEHSGEYYDDATLMKNGQKLLAQVYMSGFEDFLYTISQIGDTPITFVGYPSEDGTSNHLFSVDTPFAISATCQAKDVAWTFLSELVRKDWQTGYNIWNFPVNKAAFDEKMEQAMTEQYQTDENGDQILDENGDPIKLPKTSYYTAVARTADTVSPDSGRVDIYALSQEQADMILDVISKTTRVISYDESIMNIVTDEAAPFFAGQATAEETAAAIQSRVQLYVAEQS